MKSLIFVAITSLTFAGTASATGGHDRGVVIQQGRQRIVVQSPFVFQNRGVVRQQQRRVVIQNRSHQRQDRVIIQNRHQPQVIIQNRHQPQVIIQNDQRRRSNQGFFRRLFDRR